jgi:hypothetical protein
MAIMNEDGLKLSKWTQTSGEILFKSNEVTFYTDGVKIDLNVVSFVQNIEGEDDSGGAYFGKMYLVNRPPEGDNAYILVGAYEKKENGEFVWIIFENSMIGYTVVERKPLRKS